MTRFLAGLILGLCIALVYHKPQFVPAGLPVLEPSTHYPEIELYPSGFIHPKLHEPCALVIGFGGARYDCDWRWRVGA